MSYLDDIATEYGLDPDGFRRMAQIESGGNPRLVNQYGYSGLFQLSPSEFSKWSKGGSILDPVANAKAAAAKMAYEKGLFQWKHGREPSPTELYMQHQQGVAGSTAHLANPEAPAWANMASTGEGQQKGAGWAKRAIWGNIPDSPRYSPYFNKTMFSGVDDVTSQAFMNGWKAKLENTPVDLNAQIGGPPANQSQNDQFAGLIAPQQSTAVEPSTEDKLASAMMGGKDQTMAGAPVINVTQQRSAQAAQDLADLYNDAPGYQKLADALMQGGASMGAKARSPWEALGSIAQVASGSWQSERAKQAEKDYTDRLMAALQGGAGDAQSLARVLTASNDPDVRKAGLGLYAKALEPKATIWKPMPAETDPYSGRALPARMYNEHTGQVVTVGPGGAPSAGGVIPSAPAPSPVAPVAPATPAPSTLDAPTVVRSESYHSDGTKVEPTPVAAGSVSPAMPSSADANKPATPSVPINSVAPSPAVASPGDAYDWIKEGASKMPPGTSQLSDSNRGFAVYKGTKFPVPESKAAEAQRAKLAEKRADVQAEAEQQVGGMDAMIRNAREIAKQPGFERALSYGRHDVAKINAPYLGEISPATVLNKLGKSVNPDNPVWGTLDDIKTTQANLKLLIARPLMKGQGSVSDPERELISEAIGDLSSASSPADYQFKLNRVESMIRNVYSRKEGEQTDIAGLKSGSSISSRPTQDEIDNALKNEESQSAYDAKLNSLARKYNTDPYDMIKYVAAASAKPQSWSEYLGLATTSANALDGLPKKEKNPFAWTQPQIQSAPTPASPTAPSPPSLQAKPGVTAKSVKTQEEYDALPSGRVYIAPDGTVRRKP